MKTDSPEQALEWQKLKNEVGIGLPSDNSDDEGKAVVRFMEDLTYYYETSLDLYENEDAVPSKVELIHKGMEVADLKFLSLDEIGQALVLLSSLWSYGEDLVSAFSPIEYKMYVEALSHMIAVQQLEAQDLKETKKNLA